MHQESDQYIEVSEVMRPITKWNARLQDAAIIPEVVRKAFKVAESEKPGATHIELPEDVMCADVDATPLPRKKPSAQSPPRASCSRRRMSSAALSTRSPWPAT